MVTRDSIPRTAFVASSVFLAFLYGFAACMFEWFPYTFMANALSGQSAHGGAAAKPIIPSEHHVNPSRHDFVGVSVYGKAPSSRQDEVTLITSYWTEHRGLPGLRLIDASGRTLHHWNVDIPAIWPKSPHPDPGAGEFNHARNYVHGSYLFDNGDVLFNVEYLGLVRMNAKGEVIWRLDRRTHHSIHRNEDGNFWVCATGWVRGKVAARRFHGMRMPFSGDRILLVSPEGKVLDDFSIFEVVFASKHQSLIWTHQYPVGFDVLHLNDVESLPASIAHQYPMFAAGDLLISLRNINLVLVMDPKTKVIKWSAAGQFIEQHDPDFIGGGWISVFDNRVDGTLDGKILGGTRLTAIRPHTGETHRIYPRPSSSKHERRFHTGSGGKSQALPTGGWLITEAGAGRVFEIDGDGRTVWEWGHQRRSDGLISEVLEGTRYPIKPDALRHWDR